METFNLLEYFVAEDKGSYFWFVLLGFIHLRGRGLEFTLKARLSDPVAVSIPEFVCPRPALGCVSFAQRQRLGTPLVHILRLPCSLIRQLSLFVLLRKVLDGFDINIDLAIFVLRAPTPIARV